MFPVLTTARPTAADLARLIADAAAYPVTEAEDVAGALQPLWDLGAAYDEPGIEAERWTLDDPRARRVVAGADGPRPGARGHVVGQQRSCPRGSRMHAVLLDGEQTPCLYWPSELAEVDEAVKGDEVAPVAVPVSAPVGATA